MDTRDKNTGITGGQDSATGKGQTFQEAAEDKQLKGQFATTRKQKPDCRRPNASLIGIVWTTLLMKVITNKNTSLSKNVSDHSSSLCGRIPVVLPLKEKMEESTLNQKIKQIFKTDSMSLHGPWIRASCPPQRAHHSLSCQKYL